MTGGNRFLIISTMRDEGPYILEWLAYHRAIGFTDFLIYTNDCRDGTDLLLDRLDANGVVTHVRNKVLKRGPHKSALKYALDHPLYSEADWVYVCDVDEFLNIKCGQKRLPDLFARFPEADVIPVAWRMYSNSGLRNLNGGLVTERLTECELETPGEQEERRFSKTLFRPKPEIVRLGLHAPVFLDENDDLGNWGAKWIETDPNATLRRPSQDFGYEDAQVNHYAVRTIDAYLMKRYRGRANHVGEDLGMDYWIKWCRTGADDRSIHHHLPALKAEMETLLDDPVVAGLHQGAQGFHKKQLDELLESDSYRKLDQDITKYSGAAAPFALDDDPSEALKLKAPKRHQRRLNMLAEMPKGGRCAEIGVWNGAFSRSILDVTLPSELVLIDPWDLLAEQNPADWTHKKHSEAEEMRTMRNNVETRYSQLPNITIRQGFSAEVLASYPDHYFDWVYIDGNHLYDFVRQDLELSFQKVRPGGIVAGDDFFWKRNGRLHVKEAVLDTMKAHGFQNRPARIGQQFMITMP